MRRKKRNRGSVFHHLPLYEPTLPTRPHLRLYLHSAGVPVNAHKTIVSSDSLSLSLSLAMASTEEAGKPPASSLYDSSSPSQPLLSTHPPPPPEPDQQPGPDPDPTQYLQITYNHGPRPFKDLPFLVLFLLVVLLTFAFGIFSAFNRNTEYSDVSSYSYSSTSASCVKNSTSLARRDTLYVSSSLSSSAVTDLIWVLVITLILSVPICFSLLLLLKHYTKQVVYASLPFFVLMPVFLNVYWFVACTVSSSCSDDFPLVYRILVLVFVFLVIAVIVWIFVANWHRIELTVRIIGVASDALSRNLALFAVLPCMTLGLLIYYAPIVVFLVLARQNGEIVASESDDEYTCKWKQDSWVPAYFALAILTMLWSLTVTIEAQVYVISGTIAQWYFSKDDTAPRKKIRSSLR